MIGAHPHPGDPLGSALISLAEAKTCDFDGDGVVEELTVGEITALTAFFANLPVPRQLEDRFIPAVLGVNPLEVQEGRDRFRRSIDNGGAGCAACHRPFLPFASAAPPVLNITNPETPSVLPILVSHHTADADDVLEGLAPAQGWPGLRLWGDQELHKMGALMKNGSPARDVMKSAEGWDHGAVAPLTRDGRFTGDQMRNVILAHAGVALTNIQVTRGGQTTRNQITQQKITIKTSAAISATSTTPIRVVLTGPLPAGVTAFNANGPGPDGQFRQGAFWLITQSIPAGGSKQLTLQFNNPTGQPLTYGLTIQNHDGYSEAVASIQAFKALSSPSQNAIVSFLRAQLIGNQVGEGVAP